MGSIIPSQVDNGSSDACGIATYTLDIETFNCDDIGVNSVVLTVTDVHGNSNTCSATITIEDSILPTLKLFISGPFPFILV